MLPERVSSHPVLLRSFAPADAPRVQALAADAEVAEPTSSIPHPYPPGAAAAWIASHDADRELGREYAYAIATAAGSTLVGAIVLRPLADADNDNIGYWIGRPFWGRGYATAATMAITALAFGYLDCEALTAAHLERNAASGRVLEKCGFALLRTVERDHRGRIEAFCVRGITRDAWELRIGGAPGAGLPAEDATGDRS
ncbi:MAG TPA: GNAT family N-acetyltransferase [Casimicrobiaceae bacterium]|nr:GNAT family N-acetyltransferase [Casimicrobiaceae bacterium]